MAETGGITWGGILLRFLTAVVLVFTTYNPDGYSYIHWVRDNLEEGLPLKVFAGVVLLIAWTVFIRATLRSLGAFGLLLAAAFFGALIWLIVYYGLVPADSMRALTYIGLVVLCGVLATGVSWSHIRRRITGQVDTDELDGT
ncbi:MAG: hypothetical protein JSU62_00775 [Gammaproteobacteria bacterium]|jgi:hypothetical protein|nr:MAG: hypothetical protein JSU62_00775 [Gammaproteobacteria bacterium]